ncbi:MAG TPA: hypothetical protein VEA79_01310 [Phenylobacterium sp.]|nr:hypothetical protein [Phenylobacterium sp.]
MSRPDPLFDLFKPVLWLVVASFLVGFAGVLALAGPGAIGSPAEATELAAALQAADQGPQDS